jgi:glycosyltransferase involved in cell wall biosynthesis
MNIGMILGSTFPRDIRVEKEIRALLSAGHDITMISQGKPNMPEFEEVLGISVIRIMPPKSSLRKLAKTMWNSVFFDDLEWKRVIEKVVKEKKIDVLHCHDLPTVNLGHKVAEKFLIPVIADLHENYPEGIAVWKKANISEKVDIYTLLIFPLPIWMFKRLERSALKKVDRIITVIDEAKTHYVKDCEIPPEKVTIVMNTEDLIEFDNMRIDVDVTKDFKNDFIITYIGNFGPHRGIETALRSIAKMEPGRSNFKLLLVGSGPDDYTKRLKQLSRDLGVEDNIIFTGWIDFTLIPSYIDISDICLVPHVANGHTNTTIPHKLFQYMAKRKPLVVTDCKPLERIVKETKSGFVVPSGNSDEMAKVLDQLFTDESLRKKLGDNGRKAVEKVYNWEIEGKKLLKLYEELDR